MLQGSLSVALSSQESSSTTEAESYNVARDDITVPHGVTHATDAFTAYVAGDTAYNFHALVIATSSTSILLSRPGPSCVRDCLVM